MKAKLLIYYLISFIISCLLIISANILFMKSRIYNQDNVYNYYPNELMVQIDNSIEISQDKEIYLSKEGLDILRENNIGFQVLNSQNKEVYSYKKPTSYPMEYTNKSLLDIYSSDEMTIFLEDIVVDDDEYTYLLFFDPQKVKRMVYSYDVESMEKAHSFSTLIAINSILLLVISFIYTIKITGPINALLIKIVNLSKGNYKSHSEKIGVYSNVMGYLNDLGYKLEKSKREQEHLEQMRDDWISNISHDIKTPLTSIIGNTEIIGDTRYSLTDEMREEYCSRILSQSRYIKTLVEDLNFSTKLNSPYFKLQRDKVNIVSLMRHTIINLLNDSTFNDQNIRFNSSDENITIEIDKSLIERAFVNLIANAFIHNGPDVKVCIYIKKLSNGAICISIEDDGKGVSLYDIDNIFNRYYRGTSTSKGSEGSGLGLAITRDIVQIHDGNIKAMSESGAGLKIEIVLQ